MRASIRGPVLMSASAVTRSGRCSGESGGGVTAGRVADHDDVLDAEPVQGPGDPACLGGDLVVAIGRFVRPAVPSRSTRMTRWDAVSSGTIGSHVRLEQLLQEPKAGAHRWGTMSRDCSWRPNRT